MNYDIVLFRIIDDIAMNELYQISALIT